MSGSVNVNLPRDRDSAPIQCLSPVESTVSGFALATTTNPTVIPSGAQIVEVGVTGNCRFAFGGISVNASVGTARILVPGVYIYHVPAGATYFDAVTVGGSSGFITVAQLT